MWAESCCGWLTCDGNRYGITGRERAIPIPREIDPWLRAIIDSYKQVLFPVFIEVTRGQGQQASRVAPTRLNESRDWSRECVCFTAEINDDVLVGAVGDGDVGNAVAIEIGDCESGQIGGGPLLCPYGRCS